MEVLTEQHEVDLAPDGQAGLHLALTSEYDVMVIDRGLPAIDGISLIGRLRRRGISTPILVLTARGTVADRVEGLDAGAEDYVVKPFEIDELLARLRALLRRHSETAAMVVHRAAQARRRGTACLGDGADAVELVRKGNGPAGGPGPPSGPGVHPAGPAVQMVFDPQDGQGTVDTYVYYLRRKLGKDVVQTVHGLGYRLGAV